MFTKIESVVRFVPDIEAAAAWYADILELPVQHENAKYAFIRLESYVMGFHPTDSKCPGGVGGTTVYWEVADLARAVDVLVAKGAVLHRGPGVTTLGAKVAMLLDPFGCTIGLNESAGGR
jgi:predicted enzyme related to lactoylglutathione lyase